MAAEEAATEAEEDSAAAAAMAGEGEIWGWEAPPTSHSEVGFLDRTRLRHTETPHMHLVSTPPGLRS
jgi:hypothetical protein